MREPLSPPVRCHCADANGDGRVVFTPEAGESGDEDDDDEDEAEDDAKDEEGSAH